MSTLEKILYPNNTLIALQNISDSFSDSISEVNSVNMDNIEDSQSIVKELDGIHRDLNKTHSSLMDAVKENIEISLDNAESVYIDLKKLPNGDDFTFPYREWFEIVPASTEQVYIHLLNALERKDIIQETNNFLYECKAKNIKISFNEIFQKINLNAEDTKIFNFNLINNILNHPAGKVIDTFSKETEEVANFCKIKNITIGDEEKNFLRLLFMGLKENDKKILNAIVDTTDGLNNWSFDVSVLNKTLMDATFYTFVSDNTKTGKIPTFLINQARRAVVKNSLNNLDMFQENTQKQFLEFLSISIQDSKKFAAYNPKEDDDSIINELRARIEEKKLTLALPENNKDIKKLKI